VPQHRKHRSPKAEVAKTEERDELEEIDAITPVDFERAAKELGSPWLKKRPTYEPGSGLEARRLAWDSEVRNDPLGDDVAPGYRQLPDEERRQTLQELQNKVEELNDKYRRLPLKIETEGQRRQQQTLRMKIEETENAVSLFSRRKVLVEI